MKSDTILQLTLPLSPFLKPVKQKVKKTKRLRPLDSLNLKKMIPVLKKSEIIQVDIEGKPWSVISVYSPYSPDIHVMIMETSIDRYLPSPEYCQNSEGEGLMQLWDSVLEFIMKRKINHTIHAGFNWSPRSWGYVEEKGGFQSIPTKWHTMMWGWPEFPIKSEKTKYAKWIPIETLTLPQRRIFGSNNYSLVMGRMLKDRFEAYFSLKNNYNKIFSSPTWKLDSRGLYLDFNLSIRTLFVTEDFFSEILKPIGIILDSFMRELTEVFTDLDCKEIDGILQGIEKGMLSSEELKKLREIPEIKPVARINELFRERDLPHALLSPLLNAVNNRCKRIGSPEKWWRKGFAYALVFSSPCSAEKGRLRIMPGVYVGPGGVVEAKGILLKRLENRSISQKEILEKSQVLWNLGDHIKNRL